MKARLGDDIVRCVGYGHIGDGNMHLNITSRQYNQEVMDKIEPYLYQWTSEQKGSISAEHGMIQLSFLFQWSRNQQCNSLFIFHFVLPILPCKITQPKWQKTKNEITKICDEPGIKDTKKSFWN